MTRTTCLCPGCRRTTVKPFAEWICGTHWRAVPKTLRKRLFKCRRKAKRDPRWLHPENILWHRCKKAAVEEALMGFEI